VRTRGSANSISTAATPPVNSESGFLNTRHETESGEKQRGLAGWRKIDDSSVARLQHRLAYSFQHGLQRPGQNDWLGHRMEPALVPIT
jgi:hypothetical protein